MYKQAKRWLTVLVVGVVGGISVAALTRPDPVYNRKLDTLVRYLNTGRNVLELYRMQVGTYPDVRTSEEWKQHIGGRPKINGAFHGPFLCLGCVRMINPFNGSSEILVDVDGTGEPGAIKTSGPDACGWYYNVKTGKFAPNTPAHCHR